MAAKHGGLLSVAFSFATWLNKRRDACPESGYLLQINRETKAEVFICAPQRAKSCAGFYSSKTKRDCFYMLIQKALIRAVRIPDFHFTVLIQAKRIHNQNVISIIYIYIINITALLLMWAGSLSECCLIFHSLCTEKKNTRRRCFFYR